MGVVVPVATRWVFSQLVATMGAVLHAREYDVLFYSLDDELGRARFFDRMPLRRRVDAVLMVGIPLTESEVAILQMLRVPVVVVGSRQPLHANVRSDEVAGTRQAVRHLVNLGHSSMTMFSACGDDVISFASAPQRRAMFQEVSADAGLAYLEISTDWDFEGGSRAMEAALAGDQLPTAVFAEHAEMAFGALLTLRRAGLSVPGDVSMVSFGDHPMSAVMELTTISHLVEEQGRIGATLVIQALEDNNAEVADIVLPTRLVVRGSTSPPAGRRGRDGQGPRAHPSSVLSL